MIKDMFIIPIINNNINLYLIFNIVFIIVLYYINNNMKSYFRNNNK